jgi:hypothetical protein
MPTAPKLPRPSVYSVHPGIAIVEKWVKELPAKTGRSIEEWIALVKQEGPPTEKERREWLKTKHKVGSNAAWWIAERAEGKGGINSEAEDYLEAAEEYVREMFSGKKAALAPLYDQFLNLGFRMGEDVKACPCKTMVPLYRKHVFAQIKPTTNSRIDLGLALGDRKTPKRLINTGGFEKKDRITYRIEITKASDIDDEVKRWLKMAYEADK